jgi:hypothetical protein
MHLDRYTSFTTDYQDYEFYSDGPKGHKKKFDRQNKYLLWLKLRKQ